MLQCDLRNYFDEHEMMINNHFWGKLRGKSLDMDLVIVHSDQAQEYIEKIKGDIEEVFRDYLIEYVTVWFMSAGDFDKRYRLADKFVLKLIRSEKE